MILGHFRLSLRACDRVVKATDSYTKGQNGRGSNRALDSLVAVRNSSSGRPEPCDGNLVAGRVDGKTSMDLAPAGNKSLRLSQASHVKYDYLPTYFFQQKL